MHTAKLESSFRGSRFGSMTRSNGSERGCCCGACDSGYKWYSFRDAGWLRRICLTLLLVIVAVFVGVFCGCCLFTVFLIVVCCSSVGCCDKCEECCPACCDDDFCEDHCGCILCESCIDDDD